ncbi:MAG: PQQ-like beta-propeller repeat protein [Bacteroidaceae bacterium]|nr:PQQ-like beta-propeller repeat protein [Bacteroidaceae bacterium]
MRKLYRNTAIVTAVFVLALASMLGVSYYQMQHVSPLESEVMETLKALNESNDENQKLQQQIRQLDLLSRKAYFVQEGQLKTGIYLLVGMVTVLVACLALYYKDTKNLPEKELDPIDEWMTKSHARKYLSWAAGAAALVGIAVFIFQSVGTKALTAQSDDVEDKSEMPQEGTEAVQDSLQEIALAQADSLKAASKREQSGNFSSYAEQKQARPKVKADSTIIVKIDSAKVVETDTAVVAEELPELKIASKAFRGNNSSGTSSARGIATSWNLKSKKNILWQSTVPKHGYNSPVITGHNVFITGADEQARELYCFDVWTGELKWTVKADGISGSPSSMPKVNDDTGLAASTVATNGSEVAAIFATGDVICANMDGKRLWAKNIGLPDNHYGYASSLLMFGNILIIQYQNNSDARILALNTKNGNQIWSKATKDKIAWSSPIIAKLGGKSTLVVMGNPAIAAYNPGDGAELWRVDCMSGEVGSSPASADGLVFGASEYATCIAIDGATGETLWEASDYLPECSSLAATKDFVFCATSYGMVCAYDAKTGEVKKEHDLTTPFYSSPVVVDGKVYLFSNSGKVYIFKSSTFDLITSFETGEKTFATPAFTDGMMIVRTDESLYCVKREK